MTQSDRYHGGVIIAGNQKNALDRFCRIVASTLEDYGHHVDRQTVLDDNLARVVTNDYMIRLTMMPWGKGRGHFDRQARLDRAAGLNRDAEVVETEYEHRVEITMTPVQAGSEDREVTELMLVVMLYRVVDVFAVKQVEWMDPETVLTMDQFMGAFSNVSPRRVRSHQEVIAPKSSRFAPVEETEPGLARHCDAILGRQAHAGEEGLIRLSDEEALALAFRRDEQHPDELTAEDMAQNDIRRLATWGLTGMIAFISAPVAASVAAVNLARGEDLRLNTHVLSLTGFIAVMHGSGALTSAMQFLPL